MRLMSCSASRRTFRLVRTKCLKYASQILKTLGELFMGNYINNAQKYNIPKPSLSFWTFFLLLNIILECRNIFL